jgi:hypothetical protein
MEVAMSERSNVVSWSGTMLWLLSALAMGCTAEVEADPVAVDSEMLLPGCAPSVPEALAVPPGQRVTFYADAEGVQIYTCQADASGAPAWVFSAPEADLFNRRGRLVATHYAGPTWEALDGSTVVGTKLAAYSADPTAIPWLLLQAASHTGHGQFSNVTYIQRLDTVGGLAPTSGCDAAHLGASARVDYTATYYFYEASRPAHGRP